MSDWAQRPRSYEVEDEGLGPVGSCTPTNLGENNTERRTWKAGAFRGTTPEAGGAAGTCGGKFN